jgi:hypothetical protein
MTTKVWTSPDATDLERRMYDRLSLMDWSKPFFTHFKEGVTMNQLTLGKLESAPRPKGKELAKGAAK